MTPRHPTQSLPRLEQQLEQSLHRLRHELSALSHRLNASPDYMGMLSLFWRKQAIAAAALDQPPALVRQLLEYHCAFGTSHFAFAARLADSATLKVEGQNLTIKNSPKLSASNLDIAFWKLDLQTALILRQTHWQQTLLEAAAVIYGADFEQLPLPDRAPAAFWAALARGEVAKAHGFLQRWITQVSTRKVMERGQPSLPLLDFWQVVLCNNSASANLSLQTALNAHQAYWSRRKGGRDLEGLIALPLVLACAWAHDHGIKLAAESDYLPQYLIQGMVKELA